MLEIGKHVFIAGFITDFTTSPDPTAAPTPIACDAFGAVYVHLVAGAAAGGVAGITLVSLASDAIVPAAHDGLPAFAVPALWGGTGRNVFLRAVAATSGNMNPGNGAQPTGVQIITNQAEWSIPHTPAVATRATITRAAGGAGVRHVCKAITATLAVAAADVGVAGVLVNLRDGATGAGTILWSKRLAVVAAGGIADVNITGLNIAGSPNTAMTLEFAAAPGAASFEDVTLGGISVND